MLVLLVDYDTASVNTHSTACDVDEKCDRHHLLSNHLHIEVIINKAFEHFLRDEQKFARRISIKARTFLRFF